MPVRPSAPPPDSEIGLLRGTLDLFILKTLSWGPMHGLAVVQWIERTTKARLQIEEGALYPALHRMEDKGWLEAEWGHTDAGRRAKYYRLTPAGRRQLASELAKWNRYAEAAALILGATAATS
jgi:transcriptional regulator